MSVSAAEAKMRSGLFSCAAATGLLPRELISRAEPLNNSSLLGAVRYATEGGDLSWFTDNIRYVDLTESSYFSDLYMENMMFDIE